MQVFSLPFGSITITNTECEIVLEAFLPELASLCGLPPCTGADIYAGSQEHVV